MKIVQKPSEFVDLFLGAQREAAAAFGVNTILLEKYITRPRHIEVQVHSALFYQSFLMFFIAIFTFSTSSIPSVAFSYS